MSDEIIEAEVTVTKVWPARGKYFAFNCAELKTEENKYGRVSAPVKFVSKIHEKQVLRIAYHETDEGYLNLDTIIISEPVLLKPATPAAKPAFSKPEINWPGIMG